MKQNKTASAQSDYIASLLYGIGLGQTGASGAAAGGAVSALKGVNRIGGYAGLGSDPATEEEEEKMDLSPELAMAPGVATQRMDRRMKRQLLNDNYNVPHFWSQKISPWTTTILLAALGAAGGYGLAKSKGIDGGIGSAIGAAGGIGASALAGLTGLTLAGLTPTRTKEEQKAYANTSSIPEYLIPGLSAYNEAKTVGRSFADSKERAKKRLEKEEEQKKQANAFTDSLSNIGAGAGIGALGGGLVSLLPTDTPKRERLKRALMLIAQGGIIGGSIAGVADHATGYQLKDVRNKLVNGYNDLMASLKQNREAKLQPIQLADDNIIA